MNEEAWAEIYAFNEVQKTEGSGITAYILILTSGPLAADGRFMRWLILSGAPGTPYHGRVRVQTTEGASRAETRERLRMGLGRIRNDTIRAAFSRWWDELNWDGEDD